MVTLCELISSLRQSEIRALKAQFAVRDRGEQDLRGKLLDIVLNDRTITDEEASRMIYNAKPGSAFSHLKNRLWEDICNVLAFQFSEPEGQAGQARVQVAHLLNVARVLKSRQLYAQSFNLSREALDLSLKYALVPELLMLKDFVSSSFPEFWLKERTRVLSILADSVKRESDRLKADNIANMISQGDNSPRHVAELRGLYKRSSCDQIKSMVHRSMINLHMISRDKEKLMKECVLLYSLTLEANRDPQTKIRDTSAFAEISKAALHVHSFDSAIEFGKAGLEFIGDDILNQVELLEILLIGHLNLKEYDEAKDVCNLLDQIFNRTNQLDFRKLKFQYLKCWYLYLSGDHKTSLKTIGQLAQFPKDKSKWHCGFYILELLNLLQLNTLFQLDYKNDAFRKFLVRHNFDDDPVLDLVYRCFKLFIDNDYEKYPTWQFISKLESEGDKRDPSCVSVVDLVEVMQQSFHQEPIRKMQGRF
jgi:hypothetical protein